jgi:hypothetical protein
MAAERLGELSRLAVADARRHVADGHAALAEQLQRLPHADLGEARAEARVAGLGEGALQLAARGRQPAGDRVELQVVRVLLLDDLHRFLEEGAAA